jgi:hypothetical protein
MLYPRTLAASSLLAGLTAHATTPNVLEVKLTLGLGVRLWRAACGSVEEALKMVAAA